MIDVETERTQMINAIGSIKSKYESEGFKRGARFKSPSGYIYEIITIGVTFDEDTHTFAVTAKSRDINVEGKRLKSSRWVMLNKEGIELL